MSQSKMLIPANLTGVQIPEGAGNPGQACAQQDFKLRPPACLREELKSESEKKGTVRKIPS